MHTITVQYFHGDQVFLFSSEEAATTAYQVLSEALKEYRKFKNDSKECVEIDSENGRSTVRLEHINSVSATDTENPLQVEWARFLGRMKAAMKLEEALHSS
jgi:hypothetical protein